MFNSVEEVKEFVNNKVQEHLPNKDVTVNYSNRMTRTLGRCREQRNLYMHKFTLTFNLRYIQENLDNGDVIKHTILHEIAHALTGAEHHHDNVWQRTCLAIGGNGKRLASGIKHSYIKPKQYYTYKCSLCGHLFKRQRQIDITRYVCGNCKGHLTKLT